MTFALRLILINMVCLTMMGIVVFKPSTGSAVLWTILLIMFVASILELCIGGNQLAWIGVIGMPGIAMHICLDLYG